MRRFLSKISRGRSGPEDVFEELLVRHLDHLYAFALRLAQNPHSAEDLVQEASLKAFKAFPGLREKSRFKGWIFQILRNTFFRQNSSRTFESLDEIENIELVADGESLLVEQVMVEEIREALDRLPAPFRAAIWLSDVEGFSQKEIAQILDCSLGTVGSRLYRGRALLRRELNPSRSKRGEGRQA